EAMVLLCEPAAFEEALLLSLVVTAPDQAALTEARGVCDGRALALLRMLEQAGARLRPLGWIEAYEEHDLESDESGEPRARALVGLSGADEAKLARVADDFAAMLRDGELWPENCQVLVSVSSEGAQRRRRPSTARTVVE
ncbi:MAG: hypothetical protein KC457_35230, partial [Myxococcales bacterium]|nr:hypothetical protein [Myxococcales bacterium]